MSRAASHAPRRIVAPWVAVISLLLAGQAAAQSLSIDQQNLSLSSHTLGGGGYSLTGQIGLPAQGVMSSGPEFSLQGAWSALSPMLGGWALTSVNHPPAPGAWTLQAQPGRLLKVYLPRLLSLARDEDGDVLRVSAFARFSANGASVDRQGSWLIYDPAGQHTLPDTVTYEVTDERASVSGILTIVAAPGSEGPTPNQLSLRLAGEDAVVEFAGIPHRTYRIQTTSELGTAWQEVGTATADQFGRFTYVEAGGAHAPSRYYRTQTP